MVAVNGEEKQNSYASLVLKPLYEMSGGGAGAMPAPGGLLDMPDVGKALDELMGNKGKGTKPGGPSGPPPDDGEPSNPIGDLFDRVTGKSKAKDDARAKQKELLDKIGGKNPARDKWLFENIDNEAFVRASTMYNGPHSQYFKLSQIP